MMKSLHVLPLAGALAALLLPSCATSDENLDERLAARERRQEEHLNRMTKRSESFDRRWERMADWEQDRQDRAWDRYMGEIPEEDFDF